MCEDLAFAQQSLKTVLNDYADLFRKRFFRGAVHPQSSGCHAAESRRDRAAAGRTLSGVCPALQQRDEADGVCRLMRKTEYDQGDIEDLLE